MSGQFCIALKLHAIQQIHVLVTLRKLSLQFLKHCVIVQWLLMGSQCDASVYNQ